MISWSFKNKDLRFGDFTLEIKSEEYSHKKRNNK